MMGLEGPGFDVFCATIQKKRKDLGLSLRDLGNAVGHTAEAIHQVELGRSVPRLLFALKIAKVLDFSLDVFKMGVSVNELEMTQRRKNRIYMNTHHPRRKLNGHQGTTAHHAGTHTHPRSCS